MAFVIILLIIIIIILLYGAEGFWDIVARIFAGGVILLIVGIILFIIFLFALA
jgi:hypothetical protein